MPDEQLLTRLHAYCDAKPGADLTLITFGEDQPTYRLLGGFLDNFACFYVAEHPKVVEVRCPDNLFNDLTSRYPQSVKISDHHKWQGQGWKWADLPLDGQIPEADLLHLIDASYTLVYDELDEQKKQYIALSEKHLNLDEALDTMVETHNLVHYREVIRNLVRPSIVMATSASSAKSLGLGQSKVGGVPDLPADWEWPLFDGKPLAFLAQVNLSEIPAGLPVEPLPKSGILYFFSKFGWQKEDGDVHPDWEWTRSKEAGYSQVLYANLPYSAVLTRRDKPEGIKTFNTAAVEFLHRPSLPRASDFCRDPAINPLGWSEDECDRFDDLYFEFYDLWLRENKVTAEHQLLGYASPIQSEITTDATRLLCEIGSDYYNADMMWGDGGSIYFIIDRTALEHHDFSFITSDFQSG
jgi:uncharacterized protein YwqG/predicted DNA-binding protein (MmcQ/YjbR family)